MIYLLYPIMIIMCFTLPFGGRLFVWLANCFLPDPVPYADEIIMGCGVISKAMWADRHPVLSALLALVVIGIVLYIFVYPLIEYW